MARPTREIAPALIAVERREASVWITLGRPDAANALSKSLLDQLSGAVDAVAGEPGVRSVVITGAGKTFCAGADLKERLAMTASETLEFLDELGGTLSTLAALPCPVIAAVNGSAFGGGLELALACDIRLAVEGAMLALPEARLGIIPGAGGTQRLARVVGTGRAKELILTGRRIDAAEARRIGLVSQVVAPEQLRGAVEAVLAEIAACGPLAVAEAKAAIDGGLGLRDAEALAFERRCYELVLGSADRDEGLRAFAEKRAPVFRGR